jgi:hypothetical protein
MTAKDLRSMHRCPVRLFCVLLLGLGTAACGSPTPPGEAPAQYNQLVQVVVSQAEARADTSFFWLRNTGNAQGRTLMLDLGIDQLRYDRGADVLCVWSGEGLWPAYGFVTAPSSNTISPDSVGTLCNIEGTCTAEQSTDRWWRFECS